MVPSSMFAFEYVLVHTYTASQFKLPSRVSMYLHTCIAFKGGACNKTTKSSRAYFQSHRIASKVTFRDDRNFWESETIIN